MRLRAVSVAIVLAASFGCAFGCGDIVGIVDLDSTEKPDAAPSPSDAAVDVAPDVALVDAGADVPGDAKIDSGPTFRRVFVTSGAFMKDGNLGGVTGANGKCAAAAGSQGLNAAGEKWIAWLSGDGMDAIDRLTWNGPYQLLDGRQVAADKAQLRSGNLTNPIELNEKKELADGTADQKRVWTGTAANGNITTNTCANWSNGFQDVGTYGRATSKDGAWTAEGNTSCVAVMRLYCFEQE